MAAYYYKHLHTIPSIITPIEKPWAKSVYWMYAITLTKDAPITKNALRQTLLAKSIDTRDFFYPLHTQPILKKYSDGRFPISDSASKRGFYVPSGLAITKEQIQKVAHVLNHTLTNL